jgi:quinol monooxygenase YgiN
MPDSGKEKTMYGTIARLHLRPGAEKQLQEALAVIRDRQAQGFVASYLYKMDEDPNVFMLAVLFADGETYHRNADDPAQDRDYRVMRELLDADPEWHDGEVVWSSPTS